MIGIANYLALSSWNGIPSGSCKTMNNIHGKEQQQK
jgi:hypothetical protein